MPTGAKAKVFMNGRSQGVRIPQRIPATHRFLSRTQVLTRGRREAEVYGTTRAREASGKAINSLDRLIAAHAVATGAILVTRDRAFYQVPGLVGIEDWATDL